MGLWTVHFGSQGHVFRKVHFVSSKTIKFSVSSFLGLSKKLDKLTQKFSSKSLLTLNIFSKQLMDRKSVYYINQPAETVQSKLPWYNVRYRGSKLQTIWQASVGVTLALGLIVAPIVAQNVRRRFTTTEVKSYAGNDRLQEMVYSHRMSIRSQLEEGRKCRIK